MVALGHAFGEVDFLLRVQKGHLAYLLEIHTHRVVDGDTLAADVGFDLGDILVDILGYLDLFYYVDVKGLEAVVDALDLLRIQLQLVQGIHHLFVGEHALLLAGFD